MNNLVPILLLLILHLNSYCCGFLSQQNYTILTEADIRQRQEDDITRISTVLSIPRVSASILLRHYYW